MKVNHKHLASCMSTQIFLKNILTEGNPLHINLVSTTQQTHGQGCRDRLWHQFKKALSFSFLIPPHEIPTLTTLEVSVLLIHFFRELSCQNLGLKWPNDLLTSTHHKWGGVLAHTASSNQLIIGVGVNLSSENFDEKDFNFTPGHLILDEKILTQSYQKDLPLQFFNYLRGHRLSTKDVIKHWNNLCVHIGSDVQVNESFEKCLKGVFVGINSFGQGLIKSKRGIIKINTGSLSF